jgi:NADH dehydrogenase
VDATLAATERVFAVGDAARFLRNGTELRMSVQFALSEGRAAARNVWRAILGRPLRGFHPRDPGYVVPMANGRSCGEALGVPVTGHTATFLHYFMSAYRSATVRGALGVCTDALHMPGRGENKGGR